MGGQHNGTTSVHSNIHNLTHTFLQIIFWWWGIIPNNQKSSLFKHNIYKLKFPSQSDGHNWFTVDSPTVLKTQEAKTYTIINIWKMPLTPWIHIPLNLHNNYSFYSKLYKPHKWGTCLSYCMITDLWWAWSKKCTSSQRAHQSSQHSMASHHGKWNAVQPVKCCSGCMWNIHDAMAHSCKWHHHLWLSAIIQKTYTISLKHKNLIKGER
jgi:hypothetical protein